MMETIFKKSISRKLRDMSFSVFTIAIRAFCPTLVLKVNLRVTKLTYLICHPCHVLNTAQIMYRLRQALISFQSVYVGANVGDGRDGRECISRMAVCTEEGSICGWARLGAFSDGEV